MRPFFFTLTFLFFIHQINAQVVYQQTYGANTDDILYDFVKTDDGGLMMVGLDAELGQGIADALVVKIDSLSNLMWAKTYGGYGDDMALNITKTFEGNYFIVGGTQSFDESTGSIYLLMVDIDGNLLWSKTLGFGDWEYAYKVIVESSTGDFLIAATTSSIGAGAKEMMVAKISSDGNLQWVRSYGTGPENDWLYNIIELDNGDFLLCGRLEFTNNFGYASLLRINNNGDLLWAKTYNDTGFGLLYHAAEDENGDIFSVGRIDKMGNGNYDMILLKTDGDGNPVWSKIWSGNDFDMAKSIQVLDDGSLLIGAITASYGFGNRDASLIKTDAQGNINWAKAYGGYAEDTQNGNIDFIINADSTIFIRGGTNSFGTSGSDFYLIKTDKNGYSGCNEMDYMPEVGIYNPEVNSPYIYCLSPGLGVANTTVNNVAYNQTVLCIDTLTVNAPIDKYQGGTLHLYPNPLLENQTLKFNHSLPYAYAEVATIHGERLKTFELDKTKDTLLNLKNLQPGVYILNFYNDAGSFLRSEKLIIK